MNPAQSAENLPPGRNGVGGLPAGTKSCTFGRTATSLVFDWPLSAVLKVTVRPGSSWLAARVSQRAKNVNSQATRRTGAASKPRGRNWRVRWRINWRVLISQKPGELRWQGNLFPILHIHHHGK